MSHFDTSTDYKQLELELQNALKADELYRLQNDAKLRAVEQRVPTYEHFRQMVKGAHLRPLDRNDSAKKSRASWNPLSNDYLINSDYDENLHKSNDKKYDENRVKTPKTYYDFMKVWTRIDDNNSKFDYLWNQRENLSGIIFRTEVPSAFFHEFLQVCASCSQNGDKFREILEIFTILPTCNRFALTISFMTSEERGLCQDTFRALLEQASRQENRGIALPSTIESLTASYGLELTP